MSRCWSRSTTSSGSIRRPPTYSTSPCAASRASPSASCSPSAPVLETAFESALERRALGRLEVGPLSLGATRRILSERLGLSLTRQLLRRIHETTLGNPLFALEVGRTLAEHGLPAIGEEIPVPDSVEDLLGTRVERLPGPVRRLLLVVALSADLRLSQAAAITGPDALDAAVDAGVVLVDGDRVRASHPLHAAVARSRSQPGERRELHLELARVVPDEELRALHLALAAEQPDTELAATVAAAVTSAFARGAPRDAAALAEHALRLTPPDSPERSARLLALAEALVIVGETQRATELLTGALESLPAGPQRGRAYMLLVAGAVTSNEEITRYLELALAESESDPGLRAAALAELAMNAAVIRVERLPQAEQWAQDALRAGQRAGPDLQRFALYALSWARALRGRPIDGLRERFLGLSDDAFYLVGTPERVDGQRLVWRGELTHARVLFARLLALADERGEPVSYFLQRLHLCELELRAGEWEAAARRLDEWGESDEGELLIWPMYERCRALLAAGRGLPGEAEEWAAKAIARAVSTGVRWDELEALRARGIAALLAHEPARAVESLRDVWEHTQREGVDDPGAFPVAPDLVEALAEIGEHDEALEVTARLRELAERQQHPWGLATAKRCAAMVALFTAYDEQAAVEMAEAAAEYASLGLRFDRRERCSAWVGRSAGFGSGVRRARRCNGRPRRSTRSARQAGPTRRVPSSCGSARADPALRVSSPRRSAAWPSSRPQGGPTRRSPAISSSA